MYSKLPAFVFGFHGCDASVKEAVLHGGEDLKPSQNKYDWLGSGIYFWEQNAQRAMDFAMLAAEDEKLTKGRIQKPSVIGAVIDLGNCMNLMDAVHIQRLKEAYHMLRDMTALMGTDLPVNQGSGSDKPVRLLDRAVIETLHIYIKDTPILKPYDTVRGLFQEGPPLYPGGGFMEQTHIQICVRNANCIKAYFDPRAELPQGFIV